MEWNSGQGITVVFQAFPKGCWFHGISCCCYNMFDWKTHVYLRIDFYFLPVSCQPAHISHPSIDPYTWQWRKKTMPHRSPKWICSWCGQTLWTIMDHYGRKANQSESAKEFWIFLDEASVSIPSFFGTAKWISGCGDFSAQPDAPIWRAPPKRHAPPERWTLCSWWGTYVIIMGDFSCRVK